MSGSIDVNASQKLRFERLSQRQIPGRVENKTWEDFIKSEERDLVSDGRNMPATIELADFHIKNEGTKEELYQELDKVLKKLLK